MKWIKTLTVITLAACLGFATVACGGGADETAPAEGEAPAEGAAPAEGEAPAEAPAEGGEASPPQ